MNSAGQQIRAARRSTTALVQDHECVARVIVLVSQGDCHRLEIVTQSGLALSG